MGERSRLGMWVLGSALVVGVCGDLLLRGTPWGLNVPVFALAIAAATCIPVFAGWTGHRRSVYIALAIAIVFSLALVWRASPVLAAVNVLCALLCLSLAARAGLAGHPGSLTRQGLDHLKTSAFAAAGPVPVAATEVRWHEVAPGGWGKSALPVVRGAVITAPLILVFGALLVAADAVFEDFVTGIFDFDVGLVVGHVVLILTLAWATSGLLYVILFEKGWPESVRITDPRPRWLSLGAVETGIVLGSLNALFLGFVVVQVGYLFGGTGGAGMGFSEYARRGFFELVAVVALVIPLLLLLDWLYRDEDGGGRFLLNSLTTATVGLVGVILVSALWRMSLYYREFGLTELRLYTSVFMLWLGVVLVLYLLTVPRRRRSAFGSTSFYSALAAVVLLNVINPDATIAQVNLERLEEGKRFDAGYLTELSEDAAPVIVPALPEIGDEPAYSSSVLMDDAPSTVEESVTRRWRAYGDEDWRSWNVSRATARGLVAPS